MSIKSHILRDANGDIIVQMSGDFSYDYSAPLQKQILSLVQENPDTKITLNMVGVDFVGSSGIGQFVEALKRIDRKYRANVVLSNVRPEFLRVFKIYTADDDSFFEDFIIDSDDTYELNIHFGNRSRTFRN